MRDRGLSECLTSNYTLWGPGVAYMEESVLCICMHWIDIRCLLSCTNYMSPARILNFPERRIVNRQRQNIRDRM